MFLFISYTATKRKFNTFQFFLDQMKTARQGDWVSQVLADLSQLEIHQSIEQIKEMSVQQ